MKKALNSKIRKYNSDIVVVLYITDTEYQDYIMIPMIPTMIQAIIWLSVAILTITNATKFVHRNIDINGNYIHAFVCSAYFHQDQRWIDRLIGV